MKLEILPDAEAVARRGAAVIAREARAAVEDRGRFTLAVSGGTTPWMMLRALAGEDVPWHCGHVFQVDERVVPRDDADRNLTHLRDSLGRGAPDALERIHAMEVEAADLPAAAERYARALERAAGVPPVLDLVHLGLGPDGHTASLVPGDGVLEVTDRDVALCGVYRGRRRMTLTFPALDRARRILFLVTGEAKAGVLRRLRDADPTLPAARVRRDRALLLADRAAAGEPRGTCEP